MSAEEFVDPVHMLESRRGRKETFNFAHCSTVLAAVRRCSSLQTQRAGCMPMSQHVPPSTGMIMASPEALAALRIRFTNRIGKMDDADEMKECKKIRGICSEIRFNASLFTVPLRARLVMNQVRT